MLSTCHLKAHLVHSHRLSHWQLYCTKDTWQLIGYLPLHHVLLLLLLLLLHCHLLLLSLLHLLLLLLLLSLHLLVLHVLGCTALLHHLLLRMA